MPHPELRPWEVEGLRLSVTDVLQMPVLCDELEHSTDLASAGGSGSGAGDIDAAPIRSLASPKTPRTDVMPCGSRYLIVLKIKSHSRRWLKQYQRSTGASSQTDRTPLNDRSCEFVSCISSPPSPMRRFETGSPVTAMIPNRVGCQRYSQATRSLTVRKRDSSCWKKTGSAGASRSACRQAPRRSEHASDLSRPLMVRTTLACSCPRGASGL